MAKEKKDKQRSIKHTHKRADKIYVLLFIQLLHIFISFNPGLHTKHHNPKQCKFETPKPIAHLARFA